MTKIRPLRRLDIAAFGAIFLIVAWTIGQHLTRDSLWNDELSSVYRATQPSLSAVTKAAADDVHPPAYYILLHFVVSLFGRSELVVRGLSFVLSLVTILGIWDLGRRLFGELEALFAVCLLGISQTFILYAQEARMYMLTLAALVWAGAFGLRLVEPAKRHARGVAIGLWLSATIVAYSHYVALLYLGLLALALWGGAWPDRTMMRKLALVWLGVAVAYLPWSQQLIVDLTGSGAWMKQPSWNEWTRYLLFVLGKNTPWLTGLLALVGLVLGCMGGKTPLSFRPERAAREWVLLGSVLLPFVVLMLKSRWSKDSVGVYVDRALLPSLLGAMLLAARGAGQLATLAAAARPPAAHALAIALAIGLSANAVHSDVFHKPYREDFRLTANDVISRQSGNGAVIVATAWNPFYFDYYFNLLGSNLRVGQMLSSPKDERRVAALLNRADVCQAFYIYGHRKPQPKVAKVFAKLEYHKRHEIRRRGTGVIEFRRRSCALHAAH